MNAAIRMFQPRKTESESARTDALDLSESRSGTTIGALIRDIRGLTDDQLEQIAQHQATTGLRFGESAVALGLASNEDVVFALSQQFSYPYIPQSRRVIHSELVTANQPFSKQSEAFRAIRSQLMMRLANSGEPKRAVAVVSPNSGDGKTFFTANLGVVLAQLGGRVLLMDADLRGPRLHELFGVPNTTGLSGVLSGRKEDNVIFQAPDIPSLFVMPVGVTPPNPLELIERPAFRLLILELLRRFDHVLVDTPAVTYGSDAAVIAARCGAALAVARKHKSRLDALQNLLGQVNAGNAALAGVVVNEF